MSAADVVLAVIVIAHFAGLIAVCVIDPANLSRRTP